MTLLKVLCLISFFHSSLSISTKNITDLTKCKVYYSRSGSAYKDFFEINNEAQPKGTVLDFHFSVLAPSNAHILLTPSTHVEKGDPAYEIVLGAGGNVFSDIRRSQKSQVRVTKRTPDILSSLDPVAFWIHISTEGLIEVGKEGGNFSILSWQDTDLLPLKYFSFSTWTGVEAKWYFDCPNEATNISSNSKHVIRNITYTESLREDLLYTYDPYVRPVLDINNSTLVSLSMKANYINLDIIGARLQVKGTMQMQWLDEKLKWNPKDYGNLSNLHVRNEEIWIPPLILFNAVGSGNSYIVPGAMAVVTSKGKVLWSPAIDLEAWCSPQSLGNWPNDVYECDLLFGFQIEKYSMKLEFLTNSSDLIIENYATGWEVLQLDLDWYGGEESDVYNKTLFNIPSLYLLFQLKLQSSVYNILFYAPFVVSAVLMLSTFWVCPMGYLKISLSCFQLILTSLAIIVLSQFVPPHPLKIPYLVWLNCSLLISGIVCIALNTITINLSRNKHRKSLPQVAITILTSRALQWLFLLPETIEAEGQLAYGKLNEDQSSGKETSKTQDSWKLLGLLIDRISFISLSCFIITVAVLTY